MSRKKKGTSATRDPMVMVRLSETTVEKQTEIEAQWAERDRRAAEVRAARQGLSSLEGQAVPTAAETMSGAMRVVKPPRSTADGVKSGPLPFDTDATPFVKGDPADNEVADGSDDAEGRANTGMTFPSKLIERDPAKARWAAR